MSSVSPSRVLVTHKYAEDRHLPSQGEIIVVRLSQDLFGPGSTSIIGSDLPSRVTRHNYHHAVVLDITLGAFQSVLTFTVLPMPAYSATDPTSGLSSTNWLLGQAVDFQRRHIPVPYEQSPSHTQPQPRFLTPEGFGDPLEVDGWKNSKPRWVLAVPQVTKLMYTTTFKCFEPPVKLNKDEIRRLSVYSGLSPSPVVGTMYPFPLGSGISAFGGPDSMPSGNDTVPGASSYTHQPGAGLPAGSSLAFQALYANDAVKQAFASLHKPYIVLDSGSDDDDDDDDNPDWEDTMDPVTFARYYAAFNPHFAKIVQEHDQKMRERLDQEITNWAKGVQSETIEGDAS
ncbi:hypothetical protein JOM56_015598 [Amanita muscaria]